MVSGSFDEKKLILRTLLSIQTAKWLLVATLSKTTFIRRPLCNRRILVMATSIRVAQILLHVGPQLIRGVRIADIVDL